MESKRFDDLSRVMASDASRRTVLRGIAGGMLAAIGLRAGAGAAPAPRVDICHYDADTGAYHRITISENALDAHLAHGDNGGAGCPAGYAFNSDTCACELVNECATRNLLDSCGPGGQGFCLQSVETNELVCLGTSSCFDRGCTSDADCTQSGPGSVCIYDEGSCGENHCHPPI